MAGVGGAVGGAVTDAMNAAAQPPQQVQPAPPAQQTDDMAAFKTKIEKLTVMKEAGLITEEEFARMKAKLLSDIMG